MVIDNLVDILTILYLFAPLNMKITNSTHSSCATLWLIFCILSLIVFLSAKHPSSHHYFQKSEYHVRITNGFSSNSSLPLIIWCSSERDELGSLALQEGDDFSWSLKSNFLGTVGGHQYTCTMKWDLRRRSFVAFSGGRGESRKCLWLVKEDGFYFSEDEVSWKKKFSWP
uniref:S-protein homolog n=1 Tax=Kalanchoe fedtschenkoi TaxID=63787 RepID=A0A7N0V2T5_KALFE